MKWCVSFPEEEILVVRPSMVAICMGIRPAAKLLSVLLYRYSIRKEHKDDAENMNDVKSARGEKPDQDTTFRIFRRQDQLVKDMCGEITEKTLHDTAIPTLQLLGYLNIDETSSVHCYDVQLETITQALEAYRQGAKQLEAFHREHFQLEKFLIDPELEKVLINKKKFLFQLEKVLIVNRNNSNCKRGRKPKSQAGRDTQNEKPQISIDYIDCKEESVVSTPTVSQPESTHTPLSEKPVSSDYTITPTIQGDETSAHTPMQLSTQATPIVDNSQSSHSRRATTTPATSVGVAPVMDVPMPPRDVVIIPPSVKPAQQQAAAVPPAPKEIYSQGARDIRRMYDEINEIATGHPEWEWKKMEDMAASLTPTKEDMQLVYNHLKPSGKYTIVHVWENWKLLPLLKKKPITTATGEKPKTQQQLFEEKNKRLSEMFNTRRTS